MVTKKTIKIGGRGDEPEVPTAELDAKLAELVKAARKQAFKESAEHLRVMAKALTDSRQSVINASSSFVKETAAFKLQTRSIMERVMVLDAQANVIEAME